MLKLFRHKNVAKIVLWGLLILILPAFVLWGTGSLSGTKKKGPKFVGLVNGKKITFEDFANNIMSIRAQLLLNYYNQPQILENLLNNKAFVGRIAWDRILMVNQARQNRIRVSDREVIDYIKSLPMFSRDGKFDEKFYQYILRNNLGMTPRGFEEMIRENLQMKKLNDIIAKDINVTDEEAAESYRRDNQKIKISYLFIPYSDFTSKVTVTDKEITNYYDLHKDEIMITPKGAAKEMARPATLEEAKAAVETKLREEKATPIAVKYAEEEKKKLSDAMKNDTFEDAVKKLGYKLKETPLFAKGESLEELGTLSPVSETAGGMKAGDVSDPVLLKNGIAIFKLIEIQKIEEEKFKKEKEEYLKKALEKKKESHLSNWLKGLESQAALYIDLDNYEQYYR